MVFNRYIAISLLSHLLCFGILIALHTVSDTSTKVFDVNIVAPDDKNTTIPDRKAPPAVQKKAPLPKPTKRRPPAKDLFTQARPQLDEKAPPDTMYGQGTSQSRKSDDDSKGLEEIVKPGIQTPESKGTSPSPTSEQEHASLTPGKDGMSILPGSSLFDRTTIEKYARKRSPAKKGLSFESSGFKHRGYMRMLKERIESVWHYPKEAAKRGISGDLRVTFTINRDGKLINAELVRTSGYRSLDEAVLKALKKAFPWWPLPKDYEEDTIEVTGHFIYVYGNTYAL